MDFVTVPVGQLQTEFYRILISNGFKSEKASIVSEVFTDNSVDGVYSHGVNRFPKFIGMVKAGIVKPSEEATSTNKIGNLEQWTGHEGPGIVNALKCTDRAIELAKASGIGCVALARTNHWMRGGTYGWRAAKAGCVFIGWSNTIANTPAFGATNLKLGNNPLVIAVPFQDEGNVAPGAIVLDMAMSQFSYGALENYALKKEKLPVYGGYDSKGNLTDDPLEITKTQRSLPIGYWKGSGLSLLLDLVATILSGGLSVAEITAQGPEKNLSQVFIAVSASNNAIAKKIIDDFKTSVPVVRYPGENVVKTREKNLKEGVPVSNRIWKEIKELT